MSDTVFPVSIVRDLEFAAPGEVSLRVDLHLPQGAGARVPVIVWVHGGGWRFGDRHLAPDLSRFFAQRGFAMAAIDYRLSHRALFPAQVEDLKTAIRWLRSVADSYGFDSERIGLLGSSAGAHLSALAALSRPGTFEPRDAIHVGHVSTVQAVVAGYGPTDFLQIDAHRPPDGTVSDDPETLLLPRGMTRSAAPDSFESLLVGAPIGACPERVRAANPVVYAAPGAPPFLILHGASDTTVPVHQSELLYDALAAHGNDVTLCVIEGLGHGFLNRTHLDDAPPRPMTMTRHVPGSGDRVEDRVQPVFPTIEAFFRAHLASDAVADRAPAAAER
jgi:acetyl esterase/lipase